MELEQIANVVEILGVLALIAAIIFGWIQVRQHRNDTRNAALMALASSFEDQEFTDAYMRVTSLDENIRLDELRELGEVYERAALRLGMKFETVGLMIYKGYVPIDALEDLVGGAALAIWEILNQYVEDMRVERRHPTFMEWFQWLIERLQERGKSESLPAHVAYKDWSPG
jgi:hypothetical protein